jgi:hydroxymethylpyrimidine/phosphomethylpyrimidine kinase
MSVLKKPKVVLTIAGFDPSSGAGITADLKTFAAHGLYGVACITALTVQTTQGVLRSEPVQPELVRETLKTLVEDTPPAAVKIGMLGSAEVTASVAEFLRTNRLPNVVVDPVLRSTSGAGLLEEAGVRLIREELLSIADVITPNIDEATALTRIEVTDSKTMEAACREFQKLGARNTVIKGGHLDQPRDLLAAVKLDGTLALHWYENEKAPGTSVHGTGCAYASAIACNLAKSLSLDEAVRLAHEYVFQGIKEAYSVGDGAKPFNHFHSFNNRF